MSTRISILTVVLLLFAGFTANAQYRRYKTYEIHFGVGAANVFGDLGGAAVRDNWYGIRDIQFSETRPLFYLGGRMDINEQFSAKANLFAGLASGNDAGSINDVRNYSYSAWMFEVSGQVEWNFIRTRQCLGTLLAQRRGRKGSHMMTHAYLFVGAGLAYSKISFDAHGRALATGEYTKDHTGGLAIPYGLGVRSDITPQWGVGLEMGRRYCTSDYLDGFSTSWSKSNDTYYFTTLHVIYKLQFAGGSRMSTRPGRR